jgi:prepilin-type N-terminal cleavage/methylation domain-containing protein
MGIRKRKGFNFIELVIAIVVLGIISTSFPVLLSTLTQGVRTSWKEKAFYSEFSLMALILQNYNFDNNNSNAIQYYITCDGDADLKPGERIGKERELRNFAVGRLPGFNYYCSPIGPDPGEDSVEKFNDVDDFNGYSERVGVNNEIELNVSVFYSEDSTTYRTGEIVNFSFDPSYNRTTTHTTNIKTIQIRATNGDGYILMTVPTFNIGASKFLGLNEIGD